MAQYAAADLIQKRDEVSAKIQELVGEKLKNSYLTVVGFELTDIDFSDTYDIAIEAKVQAEQEALKAKNELERIKIEAEQKIVRAEADKQQKILEAEAKAKTIELTAEADAKAIAIIQEQLDNSPDYLDFKRIEKWDGILPTTYAGESDVLLTISGKDN
jgi:regulator of protease activity HflC (stomatin/prohibitin superfamily)